jgi:hypothetical protein
MDTLYALCRCEDNRHPLPLDSAAVDEITAHKKFLFSIEAARNELLREILARGKIGYDGMEKDDHRGFLAGPASFFRTYEILRKTRRTNQPLTIGEDEFEHNTVTEMFGRCVPNAKLAHIPWFSPARYRTSIGLAWGLALLAAHFAARDSDGVVPLDLSVLVYLGVGATLVAICFTALRQNRDVRRTAAWNAAMYLDLNADLVGRGSSALAVARKEVLPRQKWFKNPGFYQEVARKIEQHAFDAELRRRLPELSGAFPTKHA